MFKDDRINRASNKGKKFLNDAVKSATQTAKKGVQWIIENPELTVAGIFATAALVRSSQSLVVSHRMAVQRKVSARSWYDSSTGFKWDLRRAMTNNDRLEILRRKKLGEDTYTILRDLRLIK